MPVACTGPSTAHRGTGDGGTDAAGAWRAGRRLWGWGPVDFAPIEEFLRGYHREHPHAGPVERRLAEVRQLVRRYGTYQHTRGELRFGVRLAWRTRARPADRCYWRGVRVRDRRHLRGAAAVTAEVIAHLDAAAGDGHIVPTVTVFAPDTPLRVGPRVWGTPLPGHAGHLGHDGVTTGDRRTMVLTAATRRLGWSVPAPGRFDPLPIVVVAGGREPAVTPLPESSLRHVPLRHPRHPWLAGLDLRWPALDTVDLGGAAPGGLDLGGVHYAAVLASCWHLGSDIGRELADPDSYDVLPALAERLGLDTSSERTLWRDRALVELNVAILHSFRRAGITVADHHTDSARLRRLLGWEGARAVGA